MAYIVINSLNDKIIQSPSLNYAIGDTVELNDIDGESYVFKVLGRKWIEGKKLFFYFDFSLRLRDFNDLEDYLFCNLSQQDLKLLESPITEMLYTGQLPSNNDKMTSLQKDLFEKLDDIAKRSGEVCMDTLLKLCETVK